MNRRSQATRFDRFFETSTELLAVLELDGTFVQANEAFRDVLGYAVESLLGTSFLGIVVPEDEPSAQKALASLAEAKALRIEVDVRRRDGTARAVAFSMRYVTDDDAVYVVGRDKGDSTSARLGAERNARLLKRTQSLAKVGGWEIVVATNELFWTDETYRIHEVPVGFEPDVATAINFYAPEAVPVITKCVEGCFRGESYDVELQLVTYTKRRIWVRASGGPVWEDGSIVRLVGAFQDIDDKKRRELELEDKLAIIDKQRSTIHSMSAPIIQVWDGVLALPVVGSLDEARAADITERLLQAVVAHAAAQVILDLTGVESVDDATADHLIRIIKATQLLGAQSIITGIRPAVAQTLVMIGASLGNTVMRSNLRDAIKAAMRSERSSSKQASSPVR